MTRYGLCYYVHMRQNKRTGGQRLKTTGMLSLLLDQSPFVNAVFDGDGRVMVASRALRLLLGIEPEKFSDLRELFRSDSDWRTLMDHLWNASGDWLVLPVADAGGKVHPVSWRSDPFPPGHVLLSAVVHAAGPTEGVSLHELTEYVSDTAESERARISSYLHDRIGQHLTGIKMLASFLAKKLRDTDIDDDAMSMAEELADLTAESMTELRDLSRSLRVFDFALIDLTETIEDLVDSMSTPEMEVDLSMEELAGSVPPLKAKAVYNVVREALTNSLRHSGADRVEVRMRAIDGELHVEVRDDGCGFDPARASGGDSYGMLLMRQRALGQGMELDVRSSPGEGTVVSCRVPNLEPTEEGAS
ncbi:hypothetical protein GF402_07980 [Candidatus Fermentibacteria bacterium]|nr:hypothetical protein [Candidatus Fermentibacteria bacterium]